MNLFVLFICVIGTLGAPHVKPQFKRGSVRIIGGTDAVLGEIPYQVSLQDTSYGFSYHFCGGSIYSEDIVITAAHCIQGQDDPSLLTIVAGELDFSTDEGNEQVIVLNRIVSHELFNYHSMENDISLLFLSSSLILNEYIQPITLPLQGQTSQGSALVSGWGTTSEGGSLENILQKITVPIISDEDCRIPYGEEQVKDSMICAGFSQGGEDACNGDSGGPMACESTVEGVRYLCGIISWAYGCANPNFPGVYTEVAYFVDWITANALQKY